MADRPVITKAHRVLLGAVATGAFIIAGIGFAGSYSAVRDLAARKGFGMFAYVFPIGVDVGIAVLLALDLVLTWLRIPFPLLRQSAWLLTAGTIVFNAASSWGDPLAMGMHAIIPLLFIVVVEAARHAVGRIADITADRYMESVRLLRWILSPLPTFRLWRRMKLWELRSYDEVIRLEQTRLVYRTHLRAQYGRAWRYRAPLEMLLPLKLARYGVPLDLDLVRRPQMAEPAALAAPALEAPLAHNEPHPQPQTHAPATAQPGPQPAQQQQQPAAGPGAVPPPLVGPAPDPTKVAVNVLNTLARSRHRRPLSDPDIAPVPETEGEGVEQETAADLSTRGIGWLPNQQPPQPDPGPEAWFAPRTEPDQQAFDLYFEALSSYLDNFGHQPDPQRLSEYLAANYGTQVAPALLDRHWLELRQRYAERVESSS
ncbi:hypothetical protein ABIA32_001503 [Streptacidiphilus sp. MAP12-20]|uniref:DUF2637 domain-containing protein n=1 Tax=Streptacidiphilus sp. MAP12-20 TaxID=3156299 RepID=UPI003516C595